MNTNNVVAIWPVQEEQYMKSRIWSEALKIISDYGVIARWSWGEDKGFVWMSVPHGDEILEDRFIDSIDSPRRFSELNVVEIDRDFGSGSFSQEHDIEAMQKALSVVDGLNTFIENDKLIISVPEPAVTQVP